MIAGTTFGEWLRQRRSELGVTQEEFSDRLRLSRAMLRKLESGERHPSGQIANLLANYLCIPSDEQEAFVTFARTGRSAVHEAGASTDEVGRRAPWRNVHLHQTNLPFMLTVLIGRGKKEAEARDLLLQTKVRLLTLTGPPGIGKTRLALKVAHDIVEHFEDGVYFVDLTPVVDPSEVLPTIARTLRLNDEGDQPVESVLFGSLGERRMLLFLDNFEQVLDAAGEIVKLIEASPWLKVLVTSREALHVRGEHRLSVPPLELPDLGQLPALEELATYSSVELFVERAQTIAPDFALTAENAADVAAICVGLEGLPLAIELAAARARHLSPMEMRAELGNRLKLLTGGARDLPARHRTLMGAVEWSYKLLDGYPKGVMEQRLFRQLGVFVGGFTPEAVRHVFRAADGAEATTSTEDLLLSLVDKNLVRRETFGGQAGGPRFGMFETIREYALDRLQESGDIEGAERAHALYFMGLAEAAEPQLAGAEQAQWLERLASEYANIRAALGWARARSKAQKTGNNCNVTEEDVEAVEVGLRLAGALYRYWHVRGYLSEGREQLAMALASQTLSPTASVSLQQIRAKALSGAGFLVYMQGDYAEAASLHQESLTIRRRLNDTGGVAQSLNNLGLVAFMEADYAGALSLHEESLALRREVGDKWGIAASLNNLGLVSYMQGDYTTAYSLHEESLALRREVGDKWGIALSLGNLGNVACMRGDYLTARFLYSETLAIRQEIGDNIGITVILVGLGGVAAEGGEVERGARLLGAATALWKAMNFVPELDDRIVYERGIACARAQLGDEAFEKAWVEGHDMSLEEAVAYALNLAG